MADAVAKFVIALEDALSPSASKAKSSVADLSSELRRAKSELSGYQAQLGRAKGLGDVEGFRKYSTLVDQSKRSVFDLAQKVEGARAGLGAGEAAAGEMGASLGLVAAGAAVAAAGIAALAAGIGELTIKALEVTNANQRMAASFEALGGAGAGAKTLAMLDGLSEKLPQSREQLAEWTREIQKAGVTDLSKIREELIATASAQAILGESGAAAYEKITRKVNDAVLGHHALKISSKELTRTIGANLAGATAAKLGMSLGDLETKLKAGTIDAQKFGDALSATLREKGRGPLDAMMNSLETMGKKGMEAISHLFDGIETKPLTDALRSLIALGDQSAPSGEALKMGFQGAMNAIIRMLGHAIIEAEVFFLGMEVKALQVYIALKPIISAIDKISGAMGAVSGVLSGPKSKIGAGSTGGEGAPTLLENAGDTAATAAVRGLAGPLGTIGGVVWDTLAAIGDAKAQEIARQQGVNVGQATIAGIREGVQAHSPSVAAMRIGMNIGEGLGMGMMDSPAPERAARTISANALGGLGGKGLAGANDNGTSGGATTIGPIQISITAPEGVTDAQALSVIGLSTALERFQIGSGR